LLKEILPVIRRSNPHRSIVLGPANYNDVLQLDALELPRDDRNLIVTFHYYLPYHFTHQGAHWAPGSDAWLGTKWTGSDSEKQAMAADFAIASAWAKKNNRPIFLGEFGVDSKADMDSRIRWTKCVADTAAAHGFSFTYWDFCAGYFGLYDPQAKVWHKELLNALGPSE
jgi:endoglucanase